MRHCVRCGDTGCKFRTKALCNKCYLEIWRKKNPEKYEAHKQNLNKRHRELGRFAKHGITAAIYQALLEAQGFACAICGNAHERYHIDHDHACCPGEYSCGKCVRGLLCQLCNQMLGQARDSVATLQKGIDYLNGVKNLGVPA